MSLSPAILRAMQAAGASIDVIIAAVEADAAVMAERAEAKRANNAERQRRFKARKAGKVTPDNALPALPDVTSPVSPNDIYSNPLPNPSGTEVPSLCDRVVEAWNQGPAKAGAPKARKLDAARRKALCTRLKEHTEAEVFEAIANIGKSDWHCGKNDRGWSANLGWVLKNPENFNKALELGDRDNVLPLKPATELNLAQQILARKAAGGG